MRAEASIVAAVDADGVTRVTTCAGQPPLVPRVTVPGHVHLVGAAGGPHPGDVLRLSISVEPGAALTISQVAATIALPGPDDALPWSVLDVDVDIADGASLIFLGQPLVAVEGCRHRTRTRIRLHGSASVIWRELVVPGRSGEPSGDVVVELDVTRDGAPVLRQDFGVGPSSPGWNSSAVAGDARCIGSLVLSGPDEWRPAATIRLGTHAMLTPLVARGSALGTALGDAIEVTRQLEKLIPVSAVGRRDEVGPAERVGPGH